MPAEAQGLQETIAGINLEVAAVAFGAKHLLVVWRGNRAEIRFQGDLTSPEPGLIM